MRLSSGLGLWSAEREQRAAAVLAGLHVGWFLMRKIWTVNLDGVQHVVDVTWDVSATGCGCIVVDGVEVDRWNLGMKYPGKTMGLTVGAHEAELTQGVLDFSLRIGGVEAAGAERAPWSRPPAAIAIIVALVVLVLGVAGLIMLGVALAVRL